jgi:hypothetical protein
MHKMLMALISLALLASAGCATIPSDGDVVFAKVTHVFDASEYHEATANKAAFRGFFAERRLSMLEAAIDAGVSLDAVKHGRLVAAECSCGPECYTSYPLLLPANHATGPGALVVMRAGENTWQRSTQRYRYTLSTYLRSPGLPPADWKRIEGNHSHLPACFAGRWKSLPDADGDASPTPVKPSTHR